MCIRDRYDFVRQSFALKNARSVIMINAVRNSQGVETSNIVWSYGHTTIPRHLRDIVVNEYGIANLRGATDQVVVAQMLSITDSKFQSQLVEKAKQNGKIDRDFVLQNEWANNSKLHLQKTLQKFKQEGLLPDYPFGTDFTELEKRVVPVLQELKSASKSKGALLKLALKGLGASVEESDVEVLKRLGLENPQSIKDKITQLAFLGALRVVCNE